jgi:hypothetical protein
MSYGGGGYGGHYGGGYDVGRYKGGGYDDRGRHGGGRRGGDHNDRSHGRESDKVPEYEKNYRETMGIAKQQRLVDEKIADAVIFAPKKLDPSLPFPPFPYILHIVLTQIHKVRVTGQEAAQIKYQETEVEAKKIQLDLEKAKIEEIKTELQGGMDRAKAKLGGGKAKAVGGTGGQGAPSGGGDEA